MKSTKDNYSNGYVAMNWQKNYGRNDKGEKTFVCPECRYIFVNNEIENCSFCGIKFVWHG